MVRVALFILVAGFLAGVPSGRTPQSLVSESRTTRSVLPAADVDIRSRRLLTAYLSSGDDWHRLWSAKELAKRGDRGAVRFIESLLGSGKMLLGMQAAEALGEIGASSAAPALIEALRAELFEVRGGASWALGEMKAQAAVPHLESLLRDPVQDVQIYAAEALLKIRPRHQPARALLEHIFTSPSSDSWIRTLAAGGLRRAGEPAVRSYVERQLVENRRPEVRAAAAESIGLAGEPSAIETLQQRLSEEPVHWVRATVATALGRLQDSRAVSILARTARDASEDPMVRSAAIDAMNILAANASEDLFTDLLADPEDWARLSAARALLRARCCIELAREALGALLEARDPHLQIEAAGTLLDYPPTGHPRESGIASLLERASPP